MFGFRRRRRLVGDAEPDEQAAMDAWTRLDQIVQLREREAEETRRVQESMRREMDARPSAGTNFAFDVIAGRNPGRRKE